MRSDSRKQNPTNKGVKIKMCCLSDSHSRLECLCRETVAYLLWYRKPIGRRSNDRVGETEVQSRFGFLVWFKREGQNNGSSVHFIEARAWLRMDYRLWNIDDRLWTIDIRTVTVHFRPNVGGPFSFNTMASCVQSNIRWCKTMAYWEQTIRQVPLSL
ncbi:hypothetical protein BDF14DRAFT_821488 [Spinellus fusiger]|nr:hypothetical protein BDF14DRAFT_821488 [Spinellus fusiger]